MKEIRNYEVLSLWKDIEYLKWRYENHPKNKYFFHVLLHNEKPEGLIIVREVDDIIAICDIFNRTKNISQIALHLNYILNYYVKSSAQKIEFYGYDSGFFDAIFHRARFCSEISNFIFGGRVFNNTNLKEKFILPHNWLVAYGDTDII